MTLEEIDATLADAEKRLGHLQVSTEERESAMVAGELGKYPGDEAVIPQFETAGKQEFQKLRTDRLKLTEQVKKARVEDQAFKDRESLWGQTKQFASDLFAPHDLMRGAVPPKPATTPSIQALDAPQQELTLPEVEIRATAPGMGLKKESRQVTKTEEAFKSWYSGKMETDGWPKHYKDAPVDARQAFKLETAGIDTATEPQADYGLREDGTPKGKGFFGALPSRDPQYEPGTVSTELSADADIDGVNVSFPLLTPNLTRQEIDHLLTVGKPTSAIYDKAIAHAQQRLAKGLSPFASDGEQVPLPDATPSVQALDRPRSVAPDDIVGDVKPAPNVFAPGVTGRLDAAAKAKANQQTAIDAANQSSLVRRFTGPVPADSQTSRMLGKETGMQGSRLSGYYSDAPAIPVVPPTGDADPTARYPSAIPDKPLSLGEAFQQFGSKTLNGMGQLGGTALRFLGTMRYEIDKATLPEESKDKVRSDYAMFRAGTRVAEITDSMFPGRPDLQKNFLLSTLPQVFGSTLPFYAMGAAGAALGVSPGLSAAIPGAAIGGQSLYEKGVKHDVSPELQRIGMFVGGVSGLSEGAPIEVLFRSLHAVGGTDFARALKIGTIEAITEFTQELFQQTTENATVKYIFGKAQDLMEDVLPGASAGGVIGFLTGMILARRERYGSSLKSEKRPAPSIATDQFTSGPAKTSSAVANSPFGAEPTPKTGIPQVDALPDELQVAPVRPPSLIKQQPSPAAPVVTPGTVPTSQDQAPLSVSPEGGPLPQAAPQVSTEGVPFFISKQQRQALYDLGYTGQDVDAMKPSDAVGIVNAQKTKTPLPPASAPGMESPSLVPQPAVTPEAIVQGADLIPTEQPAQAPNLLQQVDQTIEAGQRKAEEPALEIPEVQITDTPLPPAPATFTGIQRGVPGIPDFELYNLTEDIPGHPSGSTVTRETLENAGYEVPEMLIEESPAPKAEAPKVELPATPEMMKPEDVQDVTPVAATQPKIPESLAKALPAPVLESKAPEIQAYLDSLPQDEAKRAYARALVDGLKAGNMPVPPRNMLSTDVLAIQRGLIKAVAARTIPRDTSDSDLVPAAAREQKGETPETAVQQPSSQSGVTFQTSKGSTYSVGHGGSTTRTKALRAEHPGDQGLKPASQKTVYVTADGLRQLGEFQTRGTGAKAIVGLPDGRYGIRYLEGPSKGKIEQRTVTEVGTEPALDMYPVELWNDGRRVHFGNKITKVSKPDKAKIIPTRGPGGSIEYVVQPLRSGATPETLTLPKEAPKDKPVAAPIRANISKLIGEVNHRATHGFDPTNEGLAESEDLLKKAQAVDDDASQHITPEQLQALRQNIKALRKRIDQESSQKTQIEKPVTPVDVAAHEAATSPTNDIPQPVDLGPAKGKSEVNKTVRDRVLADAKLFGDSANAQSVQAQGFQSIDRDRQHVMLSHVRTALNDKKVLMAIVESVPVDVMHGLIGGKATIENTLHDKSVLAHRLAVPRDVPVPKPVSAFMDALASTIVSGTTGSSAEKSGLRDESSTIQLPHDRGIAVQASDRDDRHSEEDTTKKTQAEAEKSIERPTSVTPTDIAQSKASTAPTPEEVTHDNRPTTGPVGKPPQGASQGVSTEAVSRHAQGGDTQRPRSGGLRQSGAGTQRPAQPGNAVSPSDGTDSGAALPESGTTDAPSTPAGHDYVITPEDQIEVGGPKAKFKKNVAAIRLLKKLDAEGRMATPEEQMVLVKYTGWGGLKNAFSEEDASWQKEADELRTLLTPEEYATARKSIQYAHYTDPRTIGAIWRAVQHMGLKQGSILEPGMGTGNFFGATPKALVSSLSRSGVEMDYISGRIAQQLYQRANIQIVPFQETTLPDNHFDVAIGNVPFSEVKIADQRDKTLNNLSLSLHNYFFAKALKKVRPGGIVAFITSTGTMDNKNGRAREYMASQADLIAAYRLPSGTFKGIANTEVVTDIVILRKRLESDLPAGEAWKELDEHSTTAGTFRINQYFVEHPSHILGEMRTEGTMYRADSMTVVGDADIAIGKLDSLIDALPKGLLNHTAPRSTSQESLANALDAPLDVKPGAFYVQDGKLFTKVGDKLLPYEPRTKTAKDRILGMIPVRDALKHVFSTQLRGESDAAITQAQKELTRRYDAFVQEHGLINSRANRLAYDRDPDYPVLQSLEKNYDPKADTAKKADIFTKRTIENQKDITTADSPQSALSIALNESNMVDFGRMHELTGLPEKDLQDALKGLIYQDPESGRWETASQYLSGNVRRKLATAKDAAKKNHALSGNVEALELVQPKDLLPSQIDARFGAGWIPATDVRDFIQSILDTKHGNVRYNAGQGLWQIDGFPQYGVEAVQTYGTGRKSAPELIELGLNSQIPTVTDTVDKKSVVNEQDTLAAREKLDIIKEKFNKWIWEDDARATRLAGYYNEHFNHTVAPKYDGSHLIVPGKNPGITLRPAQLNTVYRALQHENTLVAHEVGTGKTFTLATIAMEARRLGLAKKPMIVVPNHLVAQWNSQFHALFPGANVLMTTKKDFEKENRRRLMGRIATGDWDAVIVPFTSFTMLPISRDTFIEFMQEQISILETYIREERAATNDNSKEGKSRNRIVKDLEKAKERFSEKIKSRQAATKYDDAVNFEETGVDMLLVDEADLFKNLYFPTRMTRVSGLPNSESQRAFDMYMKTRYITKLNNGRGVIFATGTPISNSMAEVFTMQRYLQQSALEEAGLGHFDAWARQYGEVTSSLEMTATGKYQSKTRFANFINVPELMQMFHQVMDVVTADEAKVERPPMKTGKPINIVSTPGPALKAYVESLNQRVDRLKTVDPRVDNMLKITGDGRHAALDVRLRVPGAPEDKASKINKLVANVADIYHRTAPVKGTQLIFLDLSTPKAKGKKAPVVAEVMDETIEDEDQEVWAETSGEVLEREGVYGMIRKKLMDLGVKAHEIAYVHDAKTDKDKEELFGDVNSGKIRVLLGSTEKMGAGTNVQQRLVASHDGDAPWRPRDLEQRHGRIYRFGNRLYNFSQALAKGEEGIALSSDEQAIYDEFKGSSALLKDFHIEIYQYATEAPSFDVVMWQTLESKAKSIAQVMKGDPNIRTIQDVDSATMSASEMKAIASGNPLVLEMVGVDNDVRRYSTLKSAYQDEQYTAKRKIAQNRGYLEKNADDREKAQSDIAWLKEHPEDPFALTVGKQTHSDKTEAGDALIAAMDGNPMSEIWEIGKYRGFKLEGKRYLYRHYDEELKGYVDRPDYTIIATRKGGLTYTAEGKTPTGIIRSLAYALTKNESIAADTKGQDKRLTEEITKLEEELARPYAYEERLSKLIARQKEIKAILMPSKDDTAQVSDVSVSEDEIPEAPSKPIVPTPLEKPDDHEDLGPLGVLGSERGSIPVTPFESKPKYSKEAKSYQQQRAEEDETLGETGTIKPARAKARLQAATTSVRPVLLGALTLDQLSEVYGQDVPEVATYNSASQKMEADFSRMTRESDALLKKWDQLDRDTSDRMARIMEQARLANYDPDHESTDTYYPSFPVTDEEVAVRKAFKELPAAAQAVYRDVRDYYTQMATRRFEAIENRIKRSGGTPENRKSLLDKLHLAYDKVKAKVYFPFTRFGEHLVIAKKVEDHKEVDRVVSAFESPFEADQFAASMKAEGWTVKRSLAKVYSQDKQGGASKAVQEILDVVDSLPGEPDIMGMTPQKQQLKDAINQAFLNSLPDMSYAKHFIHAKDVKGFSRDAIRAFAHSALHGAHHISRIDNADFLANAVASLDERITETQEGDVTEPRQVYNELVLRHNAILNPNTSPVAAWLGQLGFTMSLAGSVATGITNASQVPLVTYPWLGARYGFTRSAAALSVAYKDFLDPHTLNTDSLFDASKSDRLTEEEQGMLRELQERGRIDLTQMMDLSGRASQDNLSRVAKTHGSMPDKVMKVLGFTFHAPEVMNRQVTALATFRMDRRDHNYQHALQAAEQAIISTHFIYTQENRPRYMSGNVMRVLSMFKQYSQHIAFLYGRSAQLALTNTQATPEERKVAFKQLVSMLGIQYAAAGALGLPFIGGVASLFTIMLNAFRDDDDEIDWQVELRKHLADLAGKQGGEVLSHGLSRLTPWDMSSRLGQSDLFFRAPNREREGRAAFMDWVTSFSGPVMSYATNAYLGVGDITKGIKEANTGKFMRGVEELTPAFMRNLVKSLRYEMEGGVRTRDEYKQLDVNHAEKLGQMFGFTPSRVAEMYESVTAIKNKEHQLDLSRKALLDHYAKSYQAQDHVGLQRSAADIKAFNEKHPDLAITDKTLKRSFSSRTQREALTHDGLYLPKKRESLRQEGDFANLTPSGETPGETVQHSKAWEQREKRKKMREFTEELHQQRLIGRHRAAPLPDDILP